MKHKNKRRSLGRIRKERKALLRSLSGALINYGKIKTTEAKAKEIRPVVERLVTFAKRNTIADRRLAARFLPKETVKKLFDEIAPRYGSRKGGYARIIKVPSIRKDRAKMAIIELVK